MTDPTWRDQFFASVLANIEQYGVHITGVGAGDDKPPFAYTTGLVPHGHPELVVYGLEMRIAQSLLNTLAFSVINDGACYGHGDTVHQLVRAFPVRLVRMTDTTQDLTVANSLYGVDGPIDALQLVLPDQDGRWPWQPGSGVANLPARGPVPGDDEGTEITLTD